ncbi:hypothetical protein GLW04_13580 [Halobacillus litoralis]|uniref:Uncharacterized protein n=1 Tax=Halobacillus litoralis TaxID=45668 RepID=A0A845DVW7_9BACI|nr:hypothetical protein [Halobacillus litoralis]MYL20929.1 hypothetical protein [Halobacillus litoralis]
MSGLVHVTKLLLDQTELPVSGRCSVRIDKTIVVEPFRHLTEDTFRRILKEKALIQRIRLESEEEGFPQEYEGPYTSKRTNGILIFTRTA